MIFMVSTFALLSNILLASVALAVPSTPPAAPNDLQSEPPAPVEQLVTPVYDNSIRAGVFLTGNNGDFYAVDAQFTVPHPPGDHGSIAIWAGIDGPNCNSTTFATGIDVSVAANGEVSFATWAVWYPGPSHHFLNFTIHSGDTIHFQVLATSPTTGVAWIENLTTGQNVMRAFSSEHALCEKNVEWYVEDFTPPSETRVPFLDFGTVTFTQAHAYGSHGTYGPSGADATIAAIEQNKTVLTHTSVHNGRITITRV